MKQAHDQNTYKGLSTTCWVHLLGVMAFSQGIMGCAPDPVTIRSTPQFNPQEIRSLAIVPFATIKTPQRGNYPSKGVSQADMSTPGVRRSFEVDESVHDPINPAGVTPLKEKKAGTTPTIAADKITRMFYGRILSLTNIRSISPEESAQFLIPYDLDDAWQQRKKVAPHLGNQLAVDGVLFGLVRVYRERSGAKYAAIPASVGFEVRLVRSADGRTLWVGEFFEEQKPMNEDVRGFFDRGGAFVTAEELAQSGVNRVMARFPIGSPR